MKVVHCKKDQYDVYIGRPSKWGNPYNLNEYTRDEAVDKYREFILNNQQLMNDLHELKGKILGCYCSPKRCHGDVLMELANV